MDCVPIDVFYYCVGPLMFFLKVILVVGCVGCMSECRCEFSDNEFPMGGHMCISTGSAANLNNCY